jgi:hypothetical protein
MICLALFACKGNEAPEEDADGFSYKSFSGLFPNLALPYRITDTGLAKNRDTTTIRSSEFAKLIPDSVRNRIFGKGAKVRYQAIGKLPPSGETHYFLVKGTAGTKRAALMMVFQENAFGGLLPVLEPDKLGNTSQTTVIDNAYNISKIINQRNRDNSVNEGKDIYSWDAETNAFMLIQTTPLNPSTEVINPIDTFSKRHKLAGDYVKDKMNFVSIRDGRVANQLTVFIHLYKSNGDCSGELKGDLLLTSANTAIYRQGGDPCVLNFRFSANSVMVQEDEGCGLHRGLDCLFNGNYPRKKESKSKNTSKKKD